MDRRLIEETFPIKEISELSSLEKNLRHGYISTLHTWWSRKPLAVSRAVCYASLCKMPSSKKEVEKERKWLIELSKWSNSENIDMLEKAKKRIQKQSTKLVLDCFAGGGSIPLESARLGCKTCAATHVLLSLAMKR